MLCYLDAERTLVVVRSLEFDSWLVGIKVEHLCTEHRLSVLLNADIIMTIQRIVEHLHNRQIAALTSRTFPPCRGVTCVSWPITAPPAGVSVLWARRSCQIAAGPGTRPTVAGLDTATNLFLSLLFSLQCLLNTRKMLPLPHLGGERTSLGGNLNRQTMNSRVWMTVPP